MATSNTFSTNVIADIQKEIAYSRANRDYDMFITIDGKREYIGSASTYSQAEVVTNQYVYDFLVDSNTIETAAALVLA